MNQVINSLTLQGKVAIVTGGTSGIGEATSLLFAANGAAVIIADKHEHDGAKILSKITQAGGKAKFIACDVSKEDQVKNLISQTINTFGKLDIAFNNAGIEQSPIASITQTSTEHFKQLFDTNVLGVWLCMKYEIQAMSKSGGVIVNTSSVAGHVGIADASTYIATKHAVEGLTKSVALEVATMGIRVNAVAPAATDTEMIARVVGSGESEARQNLTAMHPLGRIAKAEEIAQAVLFLASPASSFITGISLPVDGGYLAR